MNRLVWIDRAIFVDKDVEDDLLVLDEGGMAVQAAFDEFLDNDLRRARVSPGIGDGVGKFRPVENLRDATAAETVAWLHQQRIA